MSRLERCDGSGFELGDSAFELLDAPKEIGYGWRSEHHASFESIDARQRDARRPHEWHGHRLDIDLRERGPVSGTVEQLPLEGHRAESFGCAGAIVRSNFVIVRHAQHGRAREIGAGAQARAHALALADLAPLARIVVASRSADRSRALALARELSDTIGCTVDVVATPADATRAADVVVT